MKEEYMHVFIDRIGGEFEATTRGEEPEGGARGLIRFGGGGGGGDRGGFSFRLVWFEQHRSRQYT